MDDLSDTALDCVALDARGDLLGAGGRDGDRRDQDEDPSLSHSAAHYSSFADRRWGPPVPLSSSSSELSFRELVELHPVDLVLGLRGTAIDEPQYDCVGQCQGRGDGWEPNSWVKPADHGSRTSSVIVAITPGAKL